MTSPKHFFNSTGDEEEEEEQVDKDGKIKNDLRGHLNGLYNGLAKIMTTTCQLDSGKSMAPFAIEKAVHNIMFIKHHMKRQDEFDAVSFWFVIVLTRF